MTFLIAPTWFERQPIGRRDPAKGVKSNFHLLLFCVYPRAWRADSNPERFAIHNSKLKS